MAKKTITPKDPEMGTAKKANDRSEGRKSSARKVGRKTAVAKRK